MTGVDKIMLDREYNGSYFEKRGLPLKTFYQFFLGTVRGGLDAIKSSTTRNALLGSPAFPHYDIDGCLTGWIFRPDHPDFKYFYWNIQTSETVYGLPFAIPHIVAQDEVILVEGPFDALMAHAIGQENTVSILGSVVSTPQVLLLGSMTKNFVLALDNDPAGLDGMNRSQEAIKKLLPDVNVSTRYVYPHKDYCDYAARILGQ
jgi:5S rRNA maturation endonuclease (ribonuclease M5)